ncbi:unnamed protein product [Caenorhabditis bovis]|uniref:TIL domain-containing protein n=1 Tax=Caenorhabditis bovis TaxID=2654633 RepID=A0A8S1FE64_9PELO|nr:unnamed protein product [Caenorhabditis bovis]
MRILLAAVIFSLVIVTFSRNSDSDESSSREIRREKSSESEEDRSKFCPPNEKWFQCGTGCEKSCTHPRQPSLRNCDLPCIPFSCRCERGFYRDNRGTGRCVRRSKCKKW